jgi:hypothetical protein
MISLQDTLNLQKVQRLPQGAIDGEMLGAKPLTKQSSSISSSPQPHRRTTTPDVGALCLAGDQGAGETESSPYSGEKLGSSCQINKGPWRVRELFLHG